MDRETVITIAWCVPALFAIQAWLTYSLVHMFVTGRGIIERKPLEEPRGVVHGFVPGPIRREVSDPFSR